jgi:predicted glycoside hydrolase/deacetylase ChbG (UPF0249 family)
VTDPTLNARLGYPPDARLLILNADDLGLLHAVNAAAIAAVDAGAFTSGSVMSSSPWFPEFAMYARTRPDLDLGVHLTFICERPTFRWGPVLGSSVVPTLVDGSGFFPVSWEPDRPVDLKQLDAEVRAQIDRARAFGIVPTHLDSHAHTLQWRGRPVFEVLQRVARDQRLPIRIGRNWFSQYPYLAQAMESDDIVLDRSITIPPGTPPEQWTDWYVETIRSLPAGVTELFFHVGYDDGEMRAFAPARLSWGATWRQRDLDAVMSPPARDAIAASGVHRLTWRDVRRLLPEEPPRSGVAN